MSEFSEVSRYNQYKVETKDIFILFGMGAFSSAALKYIDRCQFKGTLESDLNKALYYLDICMKVNVGRPQISNRPIGKCTGSWSALNEGTTKSIGTWVHNMDTMRMEIVGDRKNSGNKYHSVVDFILRGQFEAAKEVLLLNMSINGVTVHEQ